MTDKSCPSCGKLELSIEPDCPGYPDSTRGGQLMYCYPNCGNVMSYVCLSDGCYWVYVDRLSPTHPRYDANEFSRPDWLDS